MIKLGLTSCFMYPDKNRSVFGPKSLSYMENDMVRFLSRKGVMPILLPDLEDDLLAQYLDEMDAFVFAGGSDVSPKSYNEEGIENNKWPGDIYRDEYEIKILKYALKVGKPVLGICRGFQLINAHFGGTLYQDLITQEKTTNDHRCADKYDNIHHKVTLEKESLLSKIYDNKNEIMVNSVHHQGVKTLGEDLVCEAISIPDDIIEAFRFKDMKKQFILGVQWHPEFNPTLKDIVEKETPIFDYFIKSVENNS